MISCPSCSATYQVSEPSCPECGFAPQQIGGFISWSPAVANGGGGFKPEFFSELIKLEQKNFWFKSRNKLIIWALRKYGCSFDSFLEIGCGTGFVLSAVEKAFPSVAVTGSEVFSNGLSFAATRAVRANFIQMDARDIPYVDEFSVVGAFDVLEHIPEDDKVLAAIYRAVKPGGVVMITVPQHQWLWSETDEYWCHVRRYSADEIHKKIVEAKFEILRSTSFVSLLLPAMLALRFRKKISKQFDAFEELRTPPLLNRALGAVLAIERFLIKIGIAFPAGGSRLIVARKTIHDPI